MDSIILLSVHVFHHPWCQAIDEGYSETTDMRLEETAALAGTQDGNSYGKQ